MSNKTVESILCDACQAELIEDSSYPAKYSLELKAINTGINSTGVQYAVAMYPPIKETLHFCGLSCLSQWVKKGGST